MSYSYPIVWKMNEASTVKSAIGHAGLAATAVKDDEGWCTNGAPWAYIDVAAIGLAALALLGDSWRLGQRNGVRPS